MYKSKLVQLIKTFSRSEKEGFKKWIFSPIHNQHEDCTKLLLFILSKRKLTKRVLNKKQVFQELFPNEEYDDLQFNYIMNYGVKVAEEFIGFLSNKTNKISSQKNLINFLDAHGLEKYADQHLRKLRKDQQSITAHNSNYYYQQYQLEKLVFERENKSKRLKITNLQEVFNHHYIAFVLDTLYYACEAVAHQRLYRTNYEIPLLTTVLEELKTGKLQEVPAVQLYFYSYLSLKHPEEESHFLKLRQLLKDHRSVLPKNELKNIYLTAINFCVQKLNNGFEAYVRAVFELYEYGLEYSILVDNERLSRFTYKNIATAAIRLEEYEWVAGFMDQYTPYLEPNHQENYALYIEAKLLFAQGNYDKCMRLLIQVDFDDVFLNMNAKVMLLKIYYEQEYIDPLEALLSSFKRFLQRKKIIGYQRDIYENMIYFTEKLIALPLQNKTKIEALRKEIEQAQLLTERPWLLAQLRQLR